MSNVKDLAKGLKSLFPEEDFVPLHAPIFDENEKKYVLETLESTFVSSVGEFVGRVEDGLSKMVNSAGCVATVNGSSALHATLEVLGIGFGDEVLTQSLTFVATANAISYQYADPVFIDVDRDNLGMCPTCLAEFLEKNAEVREEVCYNKISGKRIKACIPMHTFGFIGAIEAICDICSQYNIVVIEDAAEALGSHKDGKFAGTFGQMGIYSFNGNKIITSGGGGGIVSNSIELVKELKHLTTTAKMPHRWEYNHDRVGFNYRMPNINAALLSAQLEKLEFFIKEKKKLFKKYENLFSNSPLTLKKPPENMRWNYWLFSLQMEDKEQRDIFLEETNKIGVMTRPIWKLLHKLPMYKNSLTSGLTNSEFLENRIVNIPSNRFD